VHRDHYEYILKIRKRKVTVSYGYDEKEYKKQYYQKWKEAIIILNK